MRIRKHAKISPLLYATSSFKAGSLVQTHVCQLNQSPWDVMTFSPPSSPPPPPPPPPCQANGSGVRVGNGSSERCVPAFEREFTHKVEPDEAPPPPLVKNEPSSTINVCCKTDGKSWQCRREAAKGNSLCEHHLSLAKSYSSGAGTHHASKKSAVTPEAPRRSRQKKTPASGSSNPYEFYYYSGFGPRWGKRRGEGRKNNNSSMMPKNAADDEASVASTSAISNIDEFDYDEYEDEDDDDEEGRDSGKKRVRKPIKARSLKSLL